MNKQHGYSTGKYIAIAAIILINLFLRGLETYTLLLCMISFILLEILDELVEFKQKNKNNI